MMQRRLLLTVLILSFVLPLFVCHFPAKAAETSADPGREGLSVLLYSLIVDEESSHVEAEMILQNNGDSSVKTSYPLPFLSNGYVPATLQLSASRDIECTQEAVIRFTLGAGEALTLRWSYDTPKALLQETVIGCDFRELLFRKDGRIGRFEIELRLQEMDIALTESIFPANFTLEESTVRLTLTDFAVTPLLDRFYLSKSTVRSLIANRDFEPNEEQLLFIRRANEIAESNEAIGLSYLNKSMDELYCQLMGLEVTPENTDRFYRMQNNGGRFKDVFVWLIAREYSLKKAAGKTVPQFDGFGLSHYMSGDEDRAPLLVEFLRRQHTQDPLILAAILYSPEPTLAGQTLYGRKMVESLTELGYSSTYDVSPCEEITFLHTKPSGFESILFWPDAFDARLVSINGADRFTDEDLIEYLYAIRADLLIQQQMLDNRDGRFDHFKETDAGGGKYFNYALCSCPPSGNLTRDAFYESIYDEEDYRSTMVTVSERDNDLIAKLPIPAFTRYWGVVIEDDGKCIAESFLYGSVFSTYLGFNSYPKILNSEAARELTGREDARRRAADDRLDQEILTCRQDTSFIPRKPGDPEPAAESTDSAAPESGSESVSPSETASIDEEAPADDTASDTEASEDDLPSGRTAGPVVFVIVLTAAAVLLTVIIVLLLLLLRTGRK